MATGSGSQCHVSFREMLLMCLEILPSSHTRIPGRNIFITYFPIRVPEVGPLQGSGFGGATSMLKKYVPNPSHVLQHEPLEIREDASYVEKLVRIVDTKENKN